MTYMYNAATAANNLKCLFGQSSDCRIVNEVTLMDKRQWNVINEIYFLLFVCLRICILSSQCFYPVAVFNLIVPYVVFYFKNAVPEACIKGGDK